MTKEEWKSLAPLLFLGTVLLWLQATQISLSAVDAVAWASIGKEMAARGIADWVSPTIDGAAEYWHPPLFFWFLALSMKVFGGGTFAAIFPPLVLSTLTIPLLYLVGRLLAGHVYGLGTALALVLCPQFIREGRNPMLEPAVMFFTVAAVVFHLLFLRQSKWRWSFATGLAIGLIALTKGVVALLPLATLALFRPRPRHLGLVMVAAFAVLGLFELWHYGRTGGFFFTSYWKIQVIDSMVTQTHPLRSDHFFYLRELGKAFWPVLPFALAGAILAFRGRREELRAAAWLGLLMLSINLAAFSVGSRKSNWYGNLNIFPLALLAGIFWRWCLAHRPVVQWRVAFASTVVGVSILFLSSSFPSLFTYPRPMEKFFERAQVALKERLEGAQIADCASLDPWRGPRFVFYYLGARVAACDARVPFRLVRTGSFAIRGQERVLFAGDPFMILERRGD